MPTLDFKGKQFVYAHHLTVPFRQLNNEKGRTLLRSLHLIGKEVMRFPWH